jgi:hypothetical protein
MKKPTYVGSMFVETSDGVVEIGMMETPKGVMPGMVRDARTLRKPKTLPSIEQVREAMAIAMWCQENECVFEGITSKDPA